MVIRLLLKKRSEMYSLGGLYDSVIQAVRRYGNCRAARAAGCGVLARIRASCHPELNNIGSIPSELSSIYLQTKRIIKHITVTRFWVRSISKYAAE